MFCVQLLGYSSGKSLKGNKKEKRENLSTFALFLRRERDSNPRRCYPQRFSRPPQSTTLPSLLNVGAKVVGLRESSKSFTKFNPILFRYDKQFRRFSIVGQQNFQNFRFAVEAPHHRF